MGNVRMAMGIHPEGFCWKLEPGESFTYSFQLNGYESSAYNRSLSWTVTFDQKRGGTMEDMLKKAKFTGTEYDEYIQNNKTKK